MKENKKIMEDQPYRTALCVFLFSALSVGLIASPARAGGSDRQPHGSIRLYGIISPGLIGTIESLAPTTINGREAQGKQMLWCGDLLRLLTDASARVRLDSVAEVTLRQSAIARFSTSLKDIQGDAERRVLIASLMQGAMVVNLEERAEAYVEVCDLAILAARGSSFRVTVKGEAAVVDRVSGIVNLQPQIKTDLRTSIKNASKSSKSEISVKEGGTKKVIVSARKFDHKSPGEEILFVSHSGRLSSQVPATEEPAPGRLLRLEIDPPDLGTVDQPTGTTDQNGELRLTFTAGRRSGRGTITARIADRDPNNERIVEERPATIIVYKPRFWTRRKILFSALAVAAALIVREGVSDNGPKLRKEGPATPVP